MRPIKDQVLVRRDEPKRQSDGGIWYPEDSKEWEAKGTVLAIGRLVKEPGIVPGARVRFKPRAGTALVPDEREPDQPKSWHRVVVLRTGEAGGGEPDKKHGPTEPYVGKGDILGVIEEE